MVTRLDFGGATYVPARQRGGGACWSATAPYMLALDEVARLRSREAAAVVRLTDLLRNLPFLPHREHGIDSQAIRAESTHRIAGSRRRRVVQN